MTARIALASWMLVFALAPLSADVPVSEDKVPAKADSKDEMKEVVIAGEILKEDARDRINNSPSKVHAFRFEKSKAYVIEMTGTGFVPFPHIEDSAGNLVAQGNNRGNAISKIRFTAAKDDVFLIFASAGDAEGKYTLTIKPFVATPVTLIPLKAPAANKPSQATAKLAANDPSEPFRDFPSKTYTVDLKGGKTYVIDLISTEYDAYLFLQDANAVLIAQDDDSGGNLNSRIRFQPPADGRFRLIASTFNGQVGGYTLRVTEQP